MTSTSHMFVSISDAEQRPGLFRAVLRALLRGRDRLGGDPGRDTRARRDAEIELDRLKSRLGSLPHTF